MNITRIGIIGAGAMGTGLAQVAAQSGLNVILVEALKENLEKGVDIIRRSLQELVDKKKMALPEKDQVIGRIQLALDLSALGMVDAIIETITEDEGQKIELFQKLDGLIPPQTIIASTTSIVSITKLARVTKRASQIVGLHFMVPVTLVPFVEVVRGVQTSESTINQALALAKKLGKETIIVHDFPGFVVNRVLAPMLNEAIFALYEGLASAPDIDKAMHLGTGHPMGPLALADLIGLDALLTILYSLYHEYGNAKYAPCPLLVKYVEAGFLGRKTKKGFYEYDS